MSADPTSAVRVAAIQHDIVWGDRDANFARLTPMIRAAAGSGARLALLTETFSTGFVMDASIGEPEGGPSAQFITEQATQNGLWVGGTCPEVAVAEDGESSEDQRPYNSFVLASPDGLHLLWPYDGRCLVHDPPDREPPRPAGRPRSSRSHSKAARETRAERNAGIR
jgi:predicted amidohydrolase